MRYIVLGSSAAGINGAKELRRCNPDGEIILISKDNAAYSRCILHHYLSGVRDLSGISFVEKDFEERYGINFIKENGCKQLKAKEKKVILDDGTELPYDKLLIATGGSSFIPSIEGIEKAEDVYGFRNLDDIERMKEAAKTKENIVIMGGGLVGVDALSGFIHLGKKPALVEITGHLLSKQLDKKAALAYENAFIEKGAKFYFDTGIKKVIVDDANRINRLILENGIEIPCDMLIVAAGVRSNLSFLDKDEVATDSYGLIIDENGCTSDKDIYGAGDVTGHSQIWSNAVKEGIVAAKNMSGIKSSMTDFFASKSTMNFEGIPTMSLGIPSGINDTYITEVKESDDIYEKIVHKDGKIYGAILQGNLSYAGILAQLIAHKIDVSKVKKPLFDIDYSDFFHIDNNFEFYYEGEV